MMKDNGRREKERREVNDQKIKYTGFGSNSSPPI